MTHAPGYAQDGLTTHVRFVPFERRFSQKLAQVTLDIDRIDEACSGLKLLSRNRFNLFAFYDRDHGERNGAPLRPWAERLFAEAGLPLDGGRIELTAFPRVLGYVFNPISVLCAFGKDGALRGVIYEVNNTFGDGHCYVAPATPGSKTHAHTAPKNLYVSPFKAVAGIYRFQLQTPAETFRLTVENVEDGARTHLATLVSKRRPLTDSWLLGRFFGLPLMTLQVIVGIHWHALLLWLRGAKYHGRPPAPTTPATIAAISDAPFPPRAIRDGAPSKSPETEVY